MVRRDDISSTERLLDLIRENSGTGPAVETPSLRMDQTGTGTVSETASLYRMETDPAEFLHGARGVILSRISRPFYHNLFSFREKITVGIDFGNGCLKLARFRSTGSQKRKLTAYMTVPAEKDLSTGKPGPEFLKSVMKTFCHSDIRTDIWAVMPLENVETRFLTVPMVSERELPNTVYWEYKKTKALNEEEYIFDFEYIGEYLQNGINRKAVMIYAAPRHEIEKIRNLFSGIGFPLTGISLYPFAIQNLIRFQYIMADGQNVCCLYVGRNWSRIDIFFSNGNLVLSSRILACMSSMLEELREGINEYLLPRNPEPHEQIQLSDSIPHPLPDNVTEEIFFGLIQNSPELETVLAENQLDISPKEIFEMLIPSIKRLIWRVERAIESCQTCIGDKGVGKIFISGEISGCRPLIEYIGTYLEKPVETREMDPFFFDFVAKDMEIPGNAAERGSYVPAVGMALSKNFFTPNFLFTHKDKQKYLNSMRADHFVTIAFVIIAVVCLGICFAQDRVIREKDRKFETLRRTYEDGIRSHEHKVFDSATIEELANRVIKRRQQARNFSSRYTDLALISAVCEVTVPPQIRLTDLKCIADGAKEKETELQDKSPGNISVVIVQGIVTAGDAVKREALLFDYQTALSAIPVFSEPLLQEKKEQVYDSKSVLYFAIQMETQK
ncbi:MAG: hypothetical protein R2941_00105 [Desulfobacterales bacterium]